MFLFLRNICIVLLVFATTAPGCDWANDEITEHHKNAVEAAAKKTNNTAGASELDKPGSESKPAPAAQASTSDNPFDGDGIWLLIALLLGGLIIVTGWHTVPKGYVGVRHYLKSPDAVKNPGLRWGFPIIYHYEDLSFQRRSENIKAMMMETTLKAPKIETLPDGSERVKVNLDDNDLVSVGTGEISVTFEPFLKPHPGESQEDALLRYYQFVGTDKDVIFENLRDYVQKELRLRISRLGLLQSMVTATDIMTDVETGLNKHILDEQIPVRVISLVLNESIRPLDDKVEAELRRASIVELSEKAELREAVKDAKVQKARNTVIDLMAAGMKLPDAQRAQYLLSQESLKVLRDIGQAPSNTIVVPNGILSELASAGIVLKNT